MSQESAIPIRDKDEDFFNSILSPLVSKWALGSTATFLRCGGSAQISTVIKDNRYFCLKLNRGNQTPGSHAALEEIFKFINEIKTIISINSPQIIPLYTPDFIQFNDRTINGLIHILDEVLKEDDLEIIYNKYSTELQKYVFFDKPKTSHTIYIGYLMIKGTALDRMLDICVNFLKRTDSTFKDDFDKWIEVFFKKKLSSFHGMKPRLQYFVLIKDMITQVLNAIDKMHDAGYVHLDIKESNILVLKPEEENTYPLFVVFDLGSARKIDEIKINEVFEATYQYLPKSIKRLHSLGEFTNHNRVKIPFNEIPDDNYNSLDIHAISCILSNILTEERFRRISANFIYNEFEELYSMAEFLSLDLKDSDGDTYELFESPNIAKSILERLEYSRKLKDSVLEDWETWQDECSGTYPRLLDDEQISSTQSFRLNLIHPASRLLILEMDSRQRIISEKMREESITDLSNLPPEHRSDFLEAIDYHERDEVIRDKYINMVCNLFENTNFLKLSARERSKIDFRPIINCRLFKRLINLHQLALTYLNAPLDRQPYELYGEHNRFDHSVGTLEIARLYLISLLKNSTWLRLRYSEEDGLFLLILSLVHDISHYPCTHYLEDSGLFPDHKVILFAILTGDLYALNLDSKADKRKIPLDYKDGPTSKDKWKTSKSSYFNNNNPEPEGLKCSRTTKFCEIADIVDFFTALKDVFESYLPGEGDDLVSKFISWCNGLFSISNSLFNSDSDKENHAQRLIFRPLECLLNGPLDVDKLHYIVNDSIHCNTSLAAAFEGADFQRLINSLRIPIRYHDYSGTYRFCLGLNINSLHLAQLLVFTRSSLFNEIYWCERARSITSMFYFLLSESYRIFKDYDEKMFSTYIGKIIRGSEHEIGDILKEMIADCNRLVPVTEKSLYCQILNDILSPFDRGRKLRCYKELCRIYPSDVFAYNKIHSNITEENQSGEFRFHSINKDLLDQIRKLIGGALHLNIENTLGHGAIIVDLPMQKVSKSKEFIKFALVNEQGFGRQVGKVWDAIESDFAENTKIIRVFIKPDILEFDREDSDLVKSELITHLS